MGALKTFNRFEVPHTFYLIEDHPNLAFKKWGSRRLDEIQAIVIHCARVGKQKPATARNIANWASCSDVKVSFHRCADVTEWINCVRDINSAWHAGKYNRKTLGLELDGRVGFPTYSFESRGKLFKQGAKAILDWILDYDIPPRKITFEQFEAGEKGILGHGDLVPAGHWKCTYPFGAINSRQYNKLWARFIDIVHKELSNYQSTKKPKIIIPDSVDYPGQKVRINYIDKPSASFIIDAWSIKNDALTLRFLDGSKKYLKLNEIEGVSGIVNGASW